MTPNPQDSAVALEVELLPCPFCGAHLPEFTRCIAGSNRHRIKCTECPGRAEFFSSTAEQAVAAWNRRASQSDGTSGGWISVDERLPADGESVVVLYWPYNNRSNHQCMTGAVFNAYSGLFLTDTDGDELHPPSHWMPAPPLPNQGENHG